MARALAPGPDCGVLPVQSSGQRLCLKTFIFIAASEEQPQTVLEGKVGCFLIRVASDSRNTVHRRGPSGGFPGSAARPSGNGNTREYLSCCLALWPGRQKPGPSGSGSPGPGGRCNKVLGGGKMRGSATQRGGREWAAGVEPQRPLDCEPPRAAVSVLLTEVPQEPHAAWSRPWINIY